MENVLRNTMESSGGRSWSWEVLATICSAGIRYELLAVLATFLINTQLFVNRQHIALLIDEIFVDSRQ